MNTPSRSEPPRLRFHPDYWPLPRSFQALCRCLATVHVVSAWETEIDRVRTAGPPREELRRSIEGENSLLQLHQPTVKAGQDR